MAPRGRLALGVLALAVVATPATAAVVSYPAGDASHFTWEGRRVVAADLTVAIDVELAAVEFAVQGANYVGVTIHDASSSGARFAVYVDSSNVSGSSIGDPNPSGRAIPNLRVATLVTSPQQTLYTLGSGGQIAGLGPNGTLRFRFELLTEWALVDDTVNHVLSIAAIVTDGLVQPAPPRKTRHLVVLGDSLSAGPGAGFNKPANGEPCGDGVLVDDAAAVWPALLCKNFTASCEVLAGSGITIVADAGYNLPLVFPWALGAMATSSWPVAERVAWAFSTAPADAVFIELGENDCHSLNCGQAAGLKKLSDAYVAFAHVIAQAYGGSLALPIFFTLANHEAGQSAAMKTAIAELTADGFSRVFLLNATTPNTLPDGTNIDVGCAAHPSATQNLLAFARARPIVASVLGW